MNAVLKLFQFDNILMVVRNMLRVGFFNNLRYIASDLVFELRYGLDTVSPIQLDELDIQFENKKDGNFYQGTNHFVFQRIFSHINIDPSIGSFIDLGSGKGKALFLASEMGFAKVIGVEFSHELVEISRKNLEKFKQKSKTKTVFEIYHDDASEFPIPPDASLIYFANPFNETLTQKVIGNILASYQKNPREIWVIHLYPKGNMAFAHHPAFHLENELPEGILVFRLKP